MRYPVATVERGFKGRVKIFFDDHPVGDVDMIVVGLENSGSVLIKKEDYSVPVQLEFGEGAQVLDSGCARQQYGTRGYRRIR
jgi:hypothetical protein